jgi:hypothetical protein
MEILKIYTELQLLKGQIDGLCKQLEKIVKNDNVSLKKKEQLKRDFNITKHISKSVVRRNLKNKNSDA